MVFIDGENFLWGIRKLFHAEFDRSDYLPRNALWDWFFWKMAEELHATEFSVGWYVIGELDFHPYIDWANESWEEVLRKAGSQAIGEELLRKTTEKGRRKAVEDYRHQCQGAQNLMVRRLADWHAMQDAITAKHPFVRFHRTGWQPCFLPGRSLGREKGVDIGLAVDLVRNLNQYDMAVLFSGDGDYVPAVKVIQEAGKKVALMEFEFRNGETLRGTARRLAARKDIVIEVPFEDLTRFLGFDTAPASSAESPA